MRRLVLALVLLFPALVVAQEQVPLTPKSRIGVGVRVRMVTIPVAVLELFADHATRMPPRLGYGFEVVRQKGNLDMSFAVEYENVSPEDGMWLEKGDNPGVVGQYPDDVEFNNLRIIGADASFVWHTNLVKRLVQLRYGAGIGVAAVLGGATQYDQVCDAGTTPETVETNCTRAVGVPPQETDIPPVFPVVNLVVGLRIRPVEAFVIDVEGGFRDVFFGGLSLKAFF